MPTDDSARRFDPVLRVISIGVQGVLNRSPGRTAKSLLRYGLANGLPAYDRPIEVVIMQHRLTAKQAGIAPGRFVSTEFVEVMMRPIKVLVYEPPMVASYVPFLKRWYFDVPYPGESPRYLELPKPVEQTYVERTASTMFTPPYEVQHVSNLAIKIAKDLFQRAETSS